MQEICSVLIISYNHEKYIAKAIESVLEQKTKYKFRIDIFDDGSKDDTKKIIKQYAKKYPKIIHKHILFRNKGAENNFLRAIKSAKTKYYAILEGDDYWCDENKLELQIDAMEAHPECSFCAHQTLIKNINDDIRSHADNKPLVTNEIFNEDRVVSYDDIKTLEKGFMNHVNSRLIRNYVVNINKLKEKQAFLSDNQQYYFLISKAPMYYINRTMTVYNQTGSGDFSGAPWDRRLRRCLNLLHVINNETEFNITERIYLDMINFARYYANIAEKMIKETPEKKMTDYAYKYYKKVDGPKGEKNEDTKWKKEPFFLFEYFTFQNILLIFNFLLLLLICLRVFGYLPEFQGL